jgi:hypothetical protein
MIPRLPAPYAYRFVGRNQILVGRIFEPGTPPGLARTPITGRTRLYAFSLGRWGWVVIRWAKREA